MEYPEHYVELAEHELGKAEIYRSEAHDVRLVNHRFVNHATYLAVMANAHATRAATYATLAAVSVELRNGR